MLQNYNGTPVRLPDRDDDSTGYRYPAERMDAVLASADHQPRISKDVSAYADLMSGYLELQRIEYSIAQHMRDLSVKLSPGR